MTGVQTCALPISSFSLSIPHHQPRPPLSAEGEAEANRTQHADAKHQAAVLRILADRLELPSWAEVEAEAEDRGGCEQHLYARRRKVRVWLLLGFELCLHRRGARMGTAGARVAGLPGAAQPPRRGGWRGMLEVRSGRERRWRARFDAHEGL